MSYKAFFAKHTIACVQGHFFTSRQILHNHRGSYRKGVNNNHKISIVLYVLFKMCLNYSQVL